MKAVWFVTGNPNNPKAVDAGREFVLRATKRGVRVRSDAGFLGGLSRGNEPADLVVVFGGDGTLFHAARSTGIPDAPFVGVNCGQRGHLMELSPRHLAREVSVLIEKKFRVDAHPRLEAIDGSKILGSAVNDCVIAPNKSAIVMKYACAVSGQFFRGIGDGVIVSTPLGSTAYAHSTGAPVVLAGAEVLLVSPVNPIEQTHRLIVAQDEEIAFSELRANRGRIEIVLDGQERVALGDRVRIRLAKKPFKLARRLSPTGQRTGRQGLSAAAQLVHARLHLDGSQTVAQLVKTTGLTEKTIRASLQKLTDRQLAERESLSGKKRNALFRSSDWPG